MVTVKDVRDFLNNISKDLVSDETITKQIVIAETKIAQQSAQNISQSTKDVAILAYASWLSYLAYVTKYERSAGTVPPFMVGHLNVLEKLAISSLSYVKQGAPEYLPPVASTESLEEDVNLT